MKNILFQHGLEIGQVINHKELISTFNCSSMGGIRPVINNNCIVIISDHTKGIYEDRWYGDVLHYTGTGRLGDQSLKGVNKSLADSRKTGITIFLFEVLQEKEYVYRGEVQLCEDPYQEQQKDLDGKFRNVWVFPLTLKCNDLGIDQEIISRYLKNQETKARKLSKDDLKEYAKLRESKHIVKRRINGEQYVRDPYITEYVKQRADGICQLCGQSAPFLDKYGHPYLECHHIEWLSMGGKDTLKNAVALCPNCHRKMHVLNLPEDQQYLKALTEMNAD